MNSFVNAARKSSILGRTENNAVTNVTSTDPLVDLFFLASSKASNFDRVDLKGLFDAAVNQDLNLALRILLWIRDPRGGAGRRKVYRDLIKHIETRFVENGNLIALEALIRATPNIGRWDDILEFQSPYGMEYAVSVISKALDNKDGLCAKWMPRQGPVANRLRNALGLTPKSYRKMLVNLTRVVETQMCARRWSEINYEHVPSLAASRYAKAFNKRDPQRYGAYVVAAQKGEAKINVDVLFPHDVIKNLKYGDTGTAEAQWKQLPNYVGNANILPVVDVSGSMSIKVEGTTSALDISTGLGMYLADKNTGAFNGVFVTFSTNPKIEALRGNSLYEKYINLTRAHWDMSTNLTGALQEVLRFAIDNKVPAKDMPAALLVISDMEFDQCGNISPLDYTRKLYNNSGYEMPSIVFWNVNSRKGNVPATVNDKGVILVGGYSPTILKSILENKFASQYEVMMDAIGKPKYDIFTY